MTKVFNPLKKACMLTLCALLMPSAFATDTLVNTVHHASSAPAIKVSVKGMVCDFCARGLEKVFSKRKEVRAIEVDLANKLITLNLKQDQDLSDSIITKLVIANGISVQNIDRQIQPGHKAVIKKHEHKQQVHKRSSEEHKQPNASQHSHHHSDHANGKQHSMHH